MKMGAFLFAAATGVAGTAAGAFLGSAWALRHFRTATETGATLFVGYVGAAVAIAAAIVAIWGVYSQRVLTRRQTTIQHIAALKADRSIQETIKKFIEISKGQDNMATWANADREGEENTLAITTVLNTFELMSTGIQRGIFEYALIKQYHASTIKRFWTAAHPFVVAVRNRTNTPTLWIEFEALNDWVSGKKSPLLALWWTGFY